jgi:CPA2 family monovalent cation:H+ antiporter-2
MTGWELLPRVVGLLAAAAVAGLILRRLGQNVVVGYLLAGLLLGPTGLGLVGAAEDVAILSELGVALLLFSIGLEFSFRRLIQLGRMASVAGTFQIALTAALVFAISYAADVPHSAAFTLGMAFAMSSTAVVLRELTDRAQLDSPYGRNAIAILLLQDVAVIPILILTDSMTQRADATALAGQIVLRGAMVVLFIAVAWVVARFVLPRILTGAALSGSRELPVVVAVCTSMGAAWGAHSLGFSPALGAFAAGIVLAESPFAMQIRADVTPLSAVFVTLFFASVGTAVRLPLSASYLELILVLAAGVMLLKMLITAAGVRIVQPSVRTALLTGVAVSQVGEFTFVISATAFRNRILTEDLFQTAMAISLVTLIATPYAMGSAPGFFTNALRRLPVRRRVALEGEHAAKHWKRVIVIGFGPAGRAVVSALSAKGIPFVILEMNPNTVLENRTEYPIDLGDATQPEVLHHLGVGASIAVVVTIPDPVACRLVVAAVQRLAPGVPVLARVRYHQYADALREAGADRIVDEEEMVGLHLAGEAVEIAAPLHAAHTSVDATDVTAPKL